MNSLDEMFVLGLRFGEMIWILTYPHDRWLDPQTVTLSVCAPGEVSVCRIGGSLPLVGGGPCCLL